LSGTPGGTVGEVDTSDPVDTHYWLVKSGYSIIASDASPSGWTVSDSGNQITISAPASATLGSNYTVGYGLRRVHHTFQGEITGDDYIGPIAAFQILDPPPARPAYGMPAFSWQGTVAGVNTGNGNKTTTLPIVGWTMRGGMSVSCGLIHNSQGTTAPAMGTKWTPTYFSYLSADSSGNETIHWDTGLSYAFKKNPDGSFTPPFGIQDKLVSNGSGKFTLTATDNTQYVFTTVSGDPGHNSYLSSITDEDGNILTIGHNSDTTINQVSDQANRKLIYSYAGGYLSTVKDPLLRVWSFFYGGSAGAGNLWYVTLPPVTAGQPATASVAFGYDNSHNITAMQSAAGRASTFAYNLVDSSLAWAKDPAGSQTTFTYNQSSPNTSPTTTVITDPNGNTLTHTYTAGNLTATTDALNYSDGTSYDYNKIASSHTDRRKNTSGFTSRFSNINSDGTSAALSTDRMKNTSETDYNAQGKPTLSKDPIGNMTAYSYMSDGHTLQQTTVTGKGSSSPAFQAISKMGGYANGLPTSFTDALSNPSSVIYDTNNWGYVASAKDANGHTSSATYNALGWKLDSTDANGYKTTYDHDNWGRVTKVTPPDSTPSVPTAISTTYDLDGNVLTVTDADNHAVTNIYDSDGRLTQTTNGRGDVVKYTYDGPTGYGSYDSNGNTQYGLLSAKADGNGHKTFYTYTHRNEPWITNYPDGTAEAAGYDENGNVNARSKPDGTHITYQYDADDRLTDIIYPHLTTTHFDYDANGRKTKMTDGTGTTGWDYSYYGLFLTAQTTPQGTVYYDYDKDGRRTTRQLVGTGSWGYTYYPAGNLKTVQTPFGETTTYSYDLADRLTRRINGDGTYQNIGYDAANQTTDLWYYTSANGLQGHLVYGHTPAGQISSLTQNSNVTTSYVYDGADQLTAETHSGDGADYSHGFTYDGNGNRLTQTTNGQPDQSLDYDAHDKLNSNSLIPLTYKYDSNGNLLSTLNRTGRQTFVYDDEDRLTQYTYCVGTISTVDTFTYNGLGLRVAKSDSTGSYSYVCDGTTPGSPVLSDGHTVFTAGLSSTISGVTSFRHEDALGSLRFLTGSGQNVLGSSVFEAFGAPVGATGSTAGTSFGFVGGADCQTDADTGLVLMGHRYYDGRLGRFINQDPAAAGTNWYIYAYNDPVNNADPLGLDAPLGDFGLRPGEMYDMEPIAAARAGLNSQLSAGLGGHFRYFEVDRVFYQGGKEIGRLMLFDFAVPIGTSLLGNLGAARMSPAAVPVFHGGPVGILALLLRSRQLKLQSDYISNHFKNKTVGDFKDKSFANLGQPRPGTRLYELADNGGNMNGGMSMEGLGLSAGETGDTGKIHMGMMTNLRNWHDDPMGAAILQVGWNYARQIP